MKEEQLTQTLQRIYNYGYLAGQEGEPKDFEAYELLDPEDVDVKRMIASLTKGE